MPEAILLGRAPGQAARGRRGPLSDVVDVHVLVSVSAENYTHCGSFSQARMLVSATNPFCTKAATSFGPKGPKLVAAF
eukprot:11196513-Lingulodinium_polyedra.AAC.1